MVGIYKITNPKGKIYIGQSVDINERRKRYEKAKCKSQTKLYSSIIKHGWNKHRFEIVSFCSQNDLNELEIYYSNLYNSHCNKYGLNIRDCGGSRARLSSETKRKIAAANIGRVVSEETRKKISDTLKGNIPHNKGYKGRQVAWNKGIPRSEETKRKLSISNSGKTGELSSSAKVINQYDMDNVFIAKWHGAREIEKKYGFKYSSINRCARGERKTAYSYIWSYE